MESRVEEIWHRTRRKQKTRCRLVVAGFDRNRKRGYKSRTNSTQSSQVSSSDNDERRDEQGTERIVLKT
jgi:hypothetical protein